jgi:hypothetical protein
MLISKGANNLDQSFFQFTLGDLIQIQDEVKRKRDVAQTLLVLTVIVAFILGIVCLYTFAQLLSFSLMIICLVIILLTYLLSSFFFIFRWANNVTDKIIRENTHGYFKTLPEITDEIKRIKRAEKSPLHERPQHILKY